MIIRAAEMERIREKLRVVSDNLPVEDLEAPRNAIWLLSDVCAQLLDCLERFQTEEGKP
jgi:hypothetical protein